jgi:hypothetical protein
MTCRATPAIACTPPPASTGTSMSCLPVIRKDFLAPAIAQAGVNVMTSDEFLTAVLTRRRQAVIESFTRAANAKKNPPVSPAELADRIANAGAPRFAEHIRPHLES